MPKSWRIGAVKKTLEDDDLVGMAEPVAKAQPVPMPEWPEPDPGIELEPEETYRRHLMVVTGPNVERVPDEIGTECYFCGMQWYQTQYEDSPCPVESDRRIMMLLTGAGPER